MNPIFRLTVRLLLVVCAWLSVWAQAADVATLVNLVGKASAIRADGKVVPLKVKDAVQEGDTLVTEKGGFAMFRFIDGGEMILRPDTQVKVNAYKFAENSPRTDKADLKLVQGGLRRMTGAIGKRGDPDADKLVTATATVGIRGTIYDTIQCNNDCGGTLENGVYFRVREGEIVVSNDLGTLPVRSGQFSYSASPTTPPVILPKDPGLPSFNPPRSMQPTTPPEGTECV